MKKLTAENVNETFMHCLFKDGEPTDDAIMVEGIRGTFGLHPERLEAAYNDVKDYLSQLPYNFRENVGNGWSFLQACMTEDGRQWGEHINMEQLFVLGIGLNLAKCLAPRTMWPILPGGMPYYVIYI